MSLELTGHFIDAQSVNIICMPSLEQVGLSVQFSWKPLAQRQALVPGLLLMIFYFITQRNEIHSWPVSSTSLYTCLDFHWSTSVS